MGLVQALAAATPVDAYDFDVRENRISTWQCLSRRLPLGQGLSDPDLIIGAGRRCQRPLLAVKRARGGTTIYLMKPHIPTRCFDLSLVPRHDDPRMRPRIIATEGVINDIKARTSSGNDGLILIGGPSDHYAWADAGLIEQIQTVVAAEPAKKWVIADSRRTPPDTAAALQGLSADNLSVVPFRETDSGWLTRQLSHCDCVWVSRDSVSMIYEALTAGAAVGVLEVPEKRSDRITRIVPDLAERGMITRYADWRAGALPRPGPPLAEAARCAKIILGRWDASTRSLRPWADH